MAVTRRKKPAQRILNRAAVAVAKKAQSKPDTQVAKDDRDRSSKATTEKEELRALKAAQYERALEWCCANDKGAKACVAANADLNLVKAAALQDRLSGRIVNGSENADKRVLTDLEESDLVEYLVQSNLGMDGKNMSEIGLKVHEILLVRRAQNRRGGRAHVPFTNAAAKVLAGGFPSKKWFTHFFSRHARKLSKKVHPALFTSHMRARSATRVCQSFLFTWCVSVMSLGSAASRGKASRRQL